MIAFAIKHGKHSQKYYFIAFEITGPGKSGWRRTSQGKTSTLKVGVQATDVDFKILIMMIKSRKGNKKAIFH